MKKLIVTVGLALLPRLGWSACAITSGPLRLEKPTVGDSGSTWAACLGRDLDIISSSAATVSASSFNVAGQIVVRSTTATGAHDLLRLENVNGLGLFKARENGDVIVGLSTSAFVSGKLGVGTLSPSDMLHINNAAGSNNIRISGDATTWLKIGFDLGAGGGRTLTWNPGSGIQFHTSDSVDAYITNNNATNADLILGAGSSTADHIHIQSGGNVGIGTASPGYKLEVSSAIRVGGNQSAGPGAIKQSFDMAGSNDYQLRESISDSLCFDADSQNSPDFCVGFNAITIGVGGTPLSVISTGTQTGTSSNPSNLDAATFIKLDHRRFGNQVHVFGEVNLDPTAAGAASFRMTLPVASNFTVQEDCSGGFNGTVDFGRIYGSAANDVCIFEFVATDGTSRGFNFWADYIVK